MRIMNGVSYKTREIVLSLSCDLPLYEVDVSELSQQDGRGKKTANLV